MAYLEWEGFYMTELDYISLIAALDNEIDSLKQQLAEANARIGSLNGLVIETYHPHSSRHRDGSPPPPWASESSAKE